MVSAMGSGRGWGSGKDRMLVTEEGREEGSIEGVNVRSVIGPE